MKSSKYYLIALLSILGIDLSLGQIKVHWDGRYLQEANGKPFFWIGDTDWELFHRLTREEAKLLIQTRAKQGFNVLQAVALAEFEGIRTPNRYGDYPLKNNDPTALMTTHGNNVNDTVEYDYWDHVDYIIQLAAKYKMYIGLLPTWGDKVAHLWGDGPIIFNTENAKEYGKLLAERYKNQWNIIWILGGDRPGVYKGNNGKDYDDRSIWTAMAEGIHSVMGKNVFITYHPSGGRANATSNYLHDYTWLSMNAFQSGHGSREAESWLWTRKDWSMNPLKPTLDMEPCYEDHPVNPWDGKWTRQRGYFTAYDVRARIYRGIFTGQCGVTYGHHHVWQFLNTKLYQPVNTGDTLIPWNKAILSEAATQLIHLKKLMLSRPYFNRISDLSIIISDTGTTYKDRVEATRAMDNSYAMVYSPEAKPLKINMDKVSGANKKVWYFNVKNGKVTHLKNIYHHGVQTILPPDLATDWVLVIDDANKGYQAPGKLIHK